MTDIDWVRIGSMIQLGAGFGSEQSNHIRDMLLGPAVSSAGFLKADTHFQCFCLDFFDLKEIQ